MSQRIAPYPPPLPGITVQEFPDILPIFPLLGGLILPRGRLPLLMQEISHMQLVDHVLGTGRLIGLVQPDPKASATDFGPGLYQIGCVGRITSFQETDNGQYRITLTGVIRFRRTEELPSAAPWRLAKVSYDQWRHDQAMEDIDLGPRRELLMRALKDFFLAKKMSFSREAMDKFPDSVLPTALCAACPFEAAEKQALLEAQTEDRRVEILLTLLRMGAVLHESKSTN